MKQALAASNDPWEYLKYWNTNTVEKRPINTVGEFLGLGINILLGTALAVSMIALIVSGIKFITARADPKAKAVAQQSLTYSMVAFILTISAFTIKAIIFNVIGGEYGDLRNPTPGI